VRRSLVERITQQRARAFDFAFAECFKTFMHQRLGDTLLLGLRAAGALDVGASPIVLAIKEQHARPEVNGLFEFTRKVVIKAGHEQVLDPRLIIGAVVRLDRVGHVSRGKL